MVAQRESTCARPERADGVVASVSVSHPPALKSRARVIQIVTWNDWGEGTQIEPSAEFGYRDLEATQRLRRRATNTHLAGTAADLRLPVRWYRLRKAYHDDRHLMARLDAASRALLAGRLAQARALLAGMPETGRGVTP